MATKDDGAAAWPENDWGRPLADPLMAQEAARQRGLVPAEKRGIVDQALLDAIGQKHLGLARAALLLGADPTWRSPTGERAWERALASDESALAMELCLFGPHAAAASDPSLLEMACSREPRAAAELLRWGAPADERALLAAARAGSAPLAQKLIEAGADAPAAERRARAAGDAQAADLVGAALSAHERGVLADAASGAKNGAERGARPSRRPAI
jgi:hypothetical protein